MTRGCVSGKNKNGVVALRLWHGSDPLAVKRLRSLDTTTSKESSIAKKFSVSISSEVAHLVAPQLSST
jgi:hypothetical protein